MKKRFKKVAIGGIYTRPQKWYRYNDAHAIRVSKNVNPVFLNVGRFDKSEIFFSVPILYLSRKTNELGGRHLHKTSDDAIVANFLFCYVVWYCIKSSDSFL